MKKVSADRLLERALERGLLYPAEIDELERELGELPDSRDPTIERAVRLPAAAERGADAVSAVDAPAGPVGASATVTPTEVDGAPPHTEGDVPLGSRWGRYRIEARLGEGGMGRVFRAYDPVLRRYVALKTLRGDDPVRIERLLAEARSQARVEHPSICKVYEADRFEGRPYIAMQLIEGTTLDRAAREMTLEQKVEAMALAASALHAAHRHGLVHRDLKPGNFMVERREDGSFHPYVMDFGVARADEAPGLTRDGLVVGTLQYMAPEQVTGSKHLDRRADVWGLGATLYEILSGRPPFPGDGSSELYALILQEEPPALRGLEPRVPRDLETIVAKCLEKDPRRRYESARALAEDLWRFLDGEPIAARPPSLAYRVSRRIRKNRPAAAAAGIAILSVVVFGAWNVETRFDGERQAELAHQFGQELERIEGIVRTAYLLPLHDVRNERMEARERMRAIEARLDSLSGFALASAHGALGRAALALGEHDVARGHLERAWELGFRGPEAAASLGRALAGLYEQGLAEAESLVAKDLRERRLSELRSEYRQRAALYLGQSTGSAGEDPEDLAAWLAFVDGRYDDAITAARRAESRDPSHYESARLEGEAATALATQLAAVGRYEEARHRLADAGEAFARAALVGRSDPSIPVADCERWIRTAELAALTDIPDDRSFDRGISTCDRALATDPDSTTAHSRKSELLRQRGENRASRGENPLADYAVSIAESQESLRLDPRSAAARLSLGSTLIQRAQYEEDHGIDPRPSFNEAIAVYSNRRMTGALSTQALTNLGVAHGMLADFQRQHGTDPRPSLAAAARAFEDVIAADPSFLRAYNDDGLSYITLGEYELEEGRDALPTIERAIEVLQRGITLNPRYYFLPASLGIAYETRAAADAHARRDPGESYRLAAVAYRDAIALNPKSATSYHNLAGLYAGQAQDEIAHGRDPSAALALARQTLEASVPLNPSDPVLFQHRGAIAAAEAAWRAVRGGSPLEGYAAARGFFARKLAIDGEDPDALRALAEVWLWEGAWRAARSRDFEAAVARGLDAVAKLERVEGEARRAAGLHGALELLRARLLPDREERARELERAEAHLIRSGTFRPTFVEELPGVRRDFLDAIRRDSSRVNL